MSTFVVFILIAFVLALILGPIMMLQPSSAQRALADLRAKAASRGFRLKVDSQNSSLMRYYLTWADDIEFEGRCSLVRQSYVHELHFHEDWVLEDNNLAFSENQQQALKQVLEKSNKLSGVGANYAGVYVSWDERREGRPANECLDELEANLLELKRLFYDQEAS